MTLVLNQPADGSLGVYIEENLSQSNGIVYNKLYFLVAYAKMSGVARILPHLERFKQLGGEVHGVIGIDQKGTSYEALQALNQYCDNLYVFHNEASTRTYHPKIYVFEQEKENAWVSIGSSNLTGGGLYSNYEINSIYSIDLTEPNGLLEYDNILRVFTSYADLASGCCKVASLDFIEELLQEGYIKREEQLRNDIRTERRNTPQRSRRIFDYLPEPPVRITPIPIRPQTDVGGNSPNDVGTSQIAETPARLQPVENIVGFWKRLSSFDVSLTSAPGQIIIPIRFREIFPPFNDPTITSSGGEQSDTFFNIVFIDSNGRSVMIENARAIFYEPAPNHPRPNSEVRFTFRDRSILESLSADDILDFRRSFEPGVWFTIRHITTDNPEYSTFPSSARFDSY